MRKPTAWLAIAAASSILLSGGQQAPAASAWVTSKATIVTGSFTLSDGKIRTIKAVQRNRTVVSVYPGLSFYGLVGLNPDEVTLTVDVCNQNGCDLPANRICQAPLSITDANDNVVSLVSNAAGCKVNVTMDVQQTGLPRMYLDKVEMTAPAVIRNGAKILGQDAQGSDGRVIRQVGWGAGTGIPGVPQ